ncbi:MAG TPA: D-Ala-D-Ala carboxypeptidase family metallohydrolase [Lysobacter sp.]|jgi:hypothetical protein|nr:D-Ala-D-Ala carboxypeptidase family metallohydrolase [Lysobacter sp.]
MRFAALLLIVTACGRVPESAAERYARWLAAGHREQVLAYESHLRSQGVDGIVAIPQLLRSGRRWQRCHVEEFAVPPRRNWAAITATLALIRDLKDTGILMRPQVTSAWRSETFNRCEGGSSNSRHLLNNALDLDIHVDGGNVARLCDYWHRHGRNRHFGLGFYSVTKIHVDTSGFRTWGYDYSRRSSLCTKAEFAAQ